MKTPLSALLIAASIGLPHPVHAEGRVPRPPVPSAIDVPAGYRPFLAGHAVGTQGYVCVNNGNGYLWSPFGPQATLFDADAQQTLTHFLSPTPYSQLPAPAWQHSRDSSIVWGQVLASSSDSSFVRPDAIPWLLLEAAVVGDGPTGGDKLLATRYIQRVNTVAGKAPATGCAGSLDIGKRALVPYEADYVFFRELSTGGVED
jgi:hypothetical protein